MLKTLFVIGQCIRLLHTDAWQSPTYKVLEIGNYSYRTVRVDYYGSNVNFLAQENVVPFEGGDTEQASAFETVSCPDKEYK